MRNWVSELVIGSSLLLCGGPAIASDASVDGLLISRLRQVQQDSAKRAKKALRTHVDAFARIPPLTGVRPRRSIGELTAEIASIRQRRIDSLQGCLAVLQSQLPGGPGGMARSRRVASNPKHRADRSLEYLRALGREANIANLATYMRWRIAVETIALQAMEATGENFDHISEGALAFQAKFDPWRNRAVAALASSPIDVGRIDELTAEGHELFALGRRALEPIPSKVLLKETTVVDGPLAGIVDDDHMEGLVERGRDREGEAIRAALERVFVAHRDAVNDGLVAVRAWVDQLRQRAGMPHSHFILHGTRPDDRAMGASVGHQLQHRVRDVDEAKGDGNWGRYRNQSPVVLAQRLVADALARVQAVRPTDADDIRARAVAQAGGARELDADWTLAEVLQDPAKAVVALGLTGPSPHRPNQEPRYSLRADAYQEAHELFAWRGMQLLDSLARGLPEEPNLRWSFSLTDGADVFDGIPYVVKVVHVWDGERPLANQAACGTSPLFWRRFHGDSPVGNGARIVAKPAQQAVIELLVEAVLRGKPRKGLRGNQISLPEVLGLAGVDDDGAPRPDRGARKAALLVSAETLKDEGRRFVEELNRTLAEVIDDAPPHLASDVPRLAGAEITYDGDRQGIRLELQAPKGR